MTATLIRKAISTANQNRNAPGFEMEEVANAMGHSSVTQQKEYRVIRQDESCLRSNLKIRGFISGIQCPNY